MKTHVPIETTVLMRVTALVLVLGNLTGVPPASASASSDPNRGPSEHLNALLALRGERRRPHIVEGQFGEPSECFNAVVRDLNTKIASCHHNAITVGAVDSDLNIAHFSSEGDNDGKVPNIFSNWDPWEREDPDKKPEVVGPGVSIIAPGLDHGYYEYDGTSLAVPFVSGGLALILGEKTQYQHENNSGDADINKVKEQIQASSKKLPDQEKPHDNRYGYGLFQAYDLYYEL